MVATAAEGARSTAGHDADEVPRRDSCHLGGEISVHVDDHEQPVVTCGVDLLVKEPSRQISWCGIGLGCVSSSSKPLHATVPPQGHRSIIEGPARAAGRA